MRRAAALLTAAALVLTVPLADRAAGETGPDLTAEGAVLWEPATDTVLVDREADVGRPMASLTKIMTVLLALEAGALSDDVAISERSAEVGATPGGADLGLGSGDEVPMRSLLAGLVLRSGNDAAVAVAEHLAGDEPAFVDRMNERAAALGMEATQFLNSSGLTDDPDHHASPMDLARLAEVAMADDDFATWAGEEEYADAHLGVFVNRNELLEAFPGATGVKTGFTSLAGLCLVASATRDGRTLYAVVLGSEDSFADAAALLDHGFADYRRVDGGEGPVTRYRWAQGSVDLVAADPLVLTVPVEASLARRVVTDPGVPLPVEPGVEAGELAVLVDGEERVRSPLVTDARVPEPPAREPAAVAGAAVQDGLRGLTRLRPMEHEL